MPCMVSPIIVLLNYSQVDIRLHLEHLVEHLQHLLLAPL
jgi:hypothetical protein